MITTSFARGTRRNTPFLLLAIGAVGCSSSHPITTLPTVATVVVTPAKDTLAVGASVQLTATAQDLTGATVPNVVVTWGPTNSTIVSVSSTGKVTALTAGGPVIVTATASNNVAGSAAIVDTMTPAGGPATVKVVPAMTTIAVGATAQLSDTVKDASGNVLTGLTITWSSGDNTKITVSSTGLVTGVAAGGPITITAATGGKSGTAQVTDTAIVGTVKVVPASTTIAVGATAQLSDTVKDVNGNVLTGRTITWTSADNTKVTVSSSGLVTGVAAGGPVTITAATGGKSGTAQVTVTPASTVTYASISAGFDHTCAMTSAGVAYCWGAGGQGQLGDASNQAFFYKPIMVVGGQTWAVVRAGGNYSCGVTTSGTPYCWGTGPRLGDNSNTGHSSPVQVAGGLSADSVTTGDGQACIVKSGVAHCWGDNQWGAVGNNATSHNPDSTPQAVDQLALSFTNVSARGDFHACALVASGAAYCWGYNSSGQLGLGNTAGEDSVPVAAAGAETFSSIATGGEHTCGITSSGPTKCWGNDLQGALGDGGTGITGTPVVVMGSHSFVQIVAGGGFSCGRTAAGVVWCWGGNIAGQLGNNDPTHAEQSTPVQVSGGLTFTTISAGGEHACGLVAGGTAYCWGDNSSGQLGINSSTTASSPVPVAVASP